ncbi:hypothetical protein MPSEU_000120400 [Mayamaea pseudoterrestris]|nr:hypothetical protein MPSEU_000120400 [Mayamaea pseudoterrestris]
MTFSNSISKASRALAARSMLMKRNPFIAQPPQTALYYQQKRSFVASGVAAPRPAKVPGPETATSNPPAPGGGTSMMERLGSFLVGAGLAGLLSQYYLYQELLTSNARMIERQHDLEKRIKMLEGSK